MRKRAILNIFISTYQDNSLIDFQHCTTAEEGSHHSITNKWLLNPPANFLYRMVVHVPQIKPFFYREFLAISWIPEPVLYHFTFLDPWVGIL